METKKGLATYIAREEVANKEHSNRTAKKSVAVIKAKPHLEALYKIIRQMYVAKPTEQGLAHAITLIFRACCRKRQSSNELHQRNEWQRMAEENRRA